MRRLDSQGRLQIPKGLLELTGKVRPGVQVCLAFSGITRYEIVPIADEHFSDAKICTSFLSVDEKGRLTIPKDIRKSNEGKVVFTYVENGRLFIQFEKAE